MKQIDILNFKTIEMAGLDNKGEKEVPELFKVAEKRGIQLPSPHLAIFKTVYAKIEDANLNGIRLERSAVEEAMPTLIGKQVNENHQRRGFICGHIIDANLNENDEIEVSFVFYKDVYTEDFERAAEQFKNGELTVSFELYSEEDAREQLSDGTVRLHKIDFAGMGLLLDESPAYPGAIVFDMAKKVKNRISKYSDTNLVFAKKIEEQCDKIIETEQKVKALMVKSQENHEIATSWEEGHFHVAVIDAEGNGETIDIFGLDKGDHIHKVENFVVSETDHSHKMLQSMIDKLREDLEKLENSTHHIKKEKKKKKDEKYNSKTEEGGSTMALTKEQIEALKAEFGELCKDWKEEDFENEAKVEEARAVIADIEKQESESETAEETTEEASKEEDTEDARMVQKTTVTQTQEVDSDMNKEIVKEKMERTTETEYMEDEVATEEVKEEATESETKEVEEPAKAEEVIEEEAKEESAQTEEVAKEESEEATEEVKEEVEDVEALKVKIATLEELVEQEKLKYAELEASIEEIKNSAVKIAELKKELGEFAKDYSEADFLNSDKVELARTKKENAELRAKVSPEEKPKEEVVEAKAETGHDADKKVEAENPFTALMEVRRKEQREMQKKYKK